MVVLLSCTVNLYHDGLFQVNPLELVLVSPTSMYYKIPSDPLTALKLLKNDEGLCEFAKASYENNLKIDLFTKHNGYDIMEMIDEELHLKKHCKPVLGMRLESPQLLKRMLANYGVHNGYQLWYMHNDPNKLLAFCGRDVSEGKCAGLKGKKPKEVDLDECETGKHGNKKGDGRKSVNETISKVVKERWDKKKEYEKKGSLNKETVPLGCGPHG
nr:hypothetical protein [Tanacetum cinerariifolium]